MRKRILLLLVLIYSCMSGQQEKSIQSINSLTGQKTLNYDQKQGHTYNTIVRDNGSVEVIDIDLTEELNVIVEFKDEPLFLKMKKPGFQKVDGTSYQTQFAKFSSDIENIQQGLSKQLGINLKSPKIKLTYYKIFNGASLSATKAVLNAISTLNYVKKIHIDKKVQANLHESVPIIKADSVWYQFGTQGENIVVGVFDTGIDYLHPALGKGLGKGYKVLGGYDFVNNDNDPMDDHGHGTHVAGIVAANSDSLKGVAPKALLMAYKVLAANGYGDESKIIAAVERSLDPYNEGNYSHKIDIANMSLGGSGDPDDALSTAVDNAVKLGVVFCIAAGNDGQKGFNTISSPGTARSAITVGATDKQDKLAFFSSKGPNTGIYSIKPEVLAPGFDILSCFPKESNIQMGGTSMATPHVAGVCALLKKIHPSWPPEKIKAALMLSSKDVGQDIMSQGSGRIDALKAAKISTTVIPSALSYGLDNLKISVWTNEETLLVKNESKTPQKYDIYIPSSVTGISLSAEPVSFTLAPDDSLSVKFKLQVDNRIVKNPGDTSIRTSGAYSGNVYINGTQDKIHIPWAFVKSPKILVRTNASMIFSMVSQNNYYNFYFATGETQKEFLVESGKYIIMAGLFNSNPPYNTANTGYSFYIKENIDIQNNDTINIDINEAKYLLTNKIKDHLGNYIPNDPASKKSVYTYSFLLPKLSSSWGSYYSQSNTTLFSENVIFRSWGGYTQGASNSCWFFTCNPAKGIKGSTEFTNDHTKYIEQKFTLNIPTVVTSPLVTVNNDIISTTTDPNSWGVSSSQIGNFTINDNSCKGTLYITPTVSDTSRLKPGISLCINFPNKMIFEKFDAFIENDGYIGLYIYPTPPKNIFLSKLGKEFIINKGLIYPNSIHNNNNFNGEKIPSIYAGFSFYNQMNGMRWMEWQNTYVKIYNDKNQIIKESNLGSLQPVIVPPGKYRTEATNTNYKIFEKQGSLKSISNYDISQSDPNAPTIKSLQIRNSSGKPSEGLKKEEKATIHLAATDIEFNKSNISGMKVKPILDDSTQILVKESGKKVWNKLEVKKISQDTIIGSYYTADLSDYTNYDSTALDLKIIIYDLAGNNTEFTLEPAVGVGSFLGTGSDPEDPEDPDEPEIIKEYKLSNCYPNPFNNSTAINYSLPDKSNVKVEVYNVLGQKVATLVNETKDTGNYKVEWNAKNQSSGIYLCRIKAEGSKIFEKYQKIVLVK